jgi:hypothetical protein
MENFHGSSVGKSCHLEVNGGCHFFYGSWSWENDEIWIPSGYVKIAIENGPLIVDFPIENGDFP